MAVYGYTRVSTAKQVDEGQSLEVQDRVLVGYAMMQGFTIDRMFVERAVSGAVPLADRPEGARVLALLASGDTLLTSKLDRLFRSALDALGVLSRMKDMGVSLHMIDLGGDVAGSGMGKLVFTILSAVAEAERDRIRERIQQSKDENRKRGRHLGGATPFGWSKDAQGFLVPDLLQQQAMSLIRALRADDYSLRAIARKVRETGVPISHVGVQAVLARQALGPGAVGNPDGVPNVGGAQLPGYRLHGGIDLAYAAGDAADGGDGPVLVPL